MTRSYTLFADADTLLNPTSSELPEPPMYWKYLGYLGGSTLAILVGTPLDNLKNTCQAAPAGSASSFQRFTGLALANAIYQKERSTVLALCDRTSGWELFKKSTRPFWVGLAPGWMVTQLTSLGYLTLYQSLHKEKDAWYDPLTAAFIVQGVGSFVSSPVEFGKTRLQSQHLNPSRLGEFQEKQRIPVFKEVMKKSFLQDGQFSSFRGSTATILRDSLYCGVVWIGLDYVRQGVSQDRMSSAQFYGTLLGLTGVATCISHPLDAVKTHQQSANWDKPVRGGHIIRTKLNIQQTLQTLWKTSASSVFTHGLLPRFMRNAMMALILGHACCHAGMITDEVALRRWEEKEYLRTVQSFGVAEEQELRTRRRQKSG